MDLKLWKDTEVMDQLQDPRLMQMLLKGASNVLDVMLDYKQLMFAASSAMKIVKTKLEILDTEFKMTHNRDPIHSIQTRLKSQASILEKMAKRGIEPTTENMERYISDLAGVRVICGYVDDIYTVEQLLAEHEDIQILERKDYILSPKKSGYRSLHLIVQVPVFLPGGMRKTKVEIQLRTIGMDFWASLEHEIRYKKNLDNHALLERLENCAEVIARTDQELQSIRRQMDAHEEEPKEMEQILEKLRRFDVPLP